MDAVIQTILSVYKEKFGIQSLDIIKMQNVCTWEFLSSRVKIPFVIVDVAFFMPPTADKTGGWKCSRERENECNVMYFKDENN